MRAALKYVNESGGYLYLRRKGYPSVRLQSPLPPKGQEAGSALEKELQALFKALSAPALPGTVKAATRAYELSPDFRGLAASTQYEYRLLLKEFDEQLGVLPVTTFAAPFLLELRNAWAARGHRAANVRLTVLEHVLTPAIVAGLLNGNPFDHIKGVRRPANAPEPHRIWPDAVVSAVFEAALQERRFGLARAVAIARHVGARRGDLVKLSRAARSDGRFRFVSGKRKVPVDVAEDPELTAMLARTPDTQPLSAWQATRKAAVRRTVTESLTLVFNRQGRPYSEDGIALELRKLVERLAKAEAIDSAAYDFHGLRHARGVDLALSGVTDAEGAAMMGHSSAASFAQYRRQADRKRLADSGSQKVQARRRNEAATKAPNGVPNRRQIRAANES